MKLYRPVTLEEITAEIQRLGLSLNLYHSLDFSSEYNKITNDNVNDDRFRDLESRTEAKFETLIKEEKIKEAYELIYRFIPHYDEELYEQVQLLLDLAEAKKQIENGIVIYTDFRSD